MSVNLVLVRHGATDMSDQGRLNGWLDVPLNDRGRDQAGQLRRALADRSFDGVWSSDLLRAEQTAWVAGFEPTADHRLRELDFGELEGSTWDDCDPDMRTSLLRFDGFVAPGGESVEAMRGRVRDLIEGLSSGTHLLFTHGGPIRLVLRAMGDDSLIPPGSLIGVPSVGALSPGGSVTKA
jgi:probable phosphoglycerate mutase